MRQKGFSKKLLVDSSTKYLDICFMSNFNASRITVLTQTENVQNIFRK